MSVQKMSEEKIEGFNTQPLMLEIENVIRSGVKTILKDFMTRYELLEKTHNTIMNLPSVRNEMNKSVVEEVGQGCSPKVDIATISNIKDMTRVLVREEICVVEKKLDVIEKKFAAFGPILDKIMVKLHSLNEDVKIFKQPAGAENKTIEKLGMIQPSIVSACENENIKFEIKEEDSVAGANAGLASVASTDAITVASLEKEDPVARAEDAGSEEESDAEEADAGSEEESDAEEAGAGSEEESDAGSEEESDAEEDAVAGSEEEEEEAVAEAKEEESVAGLEDAESVAGLEEADAGSEEEDDVETETEEAVAEDEEFFEIEIDDVTFCTNDEENGLIYELTEDGEVGDKVGYLKEGEPFFYADEK
jgi:hypothetical protein